MKFSVVVFPGSNSDNDAFYATSRVLGEDAALVWHKDTDLQGADAVILPGGFAHGDYLRTGAIARFSPIMNSVKAFADRGGPVLGICNGFQVLLEAGMLPGAMVRNDRIKFVSRVVGVRVEQTDTPFTSACESKQVLNLPIAHGEGNYYAAPAELAELEANGETVHTVAEGDGPINALDNALRSALAKFFPAIAQVRLVDYKVRIVDAKTGTAAKTRVIIESTDGADTWGTVGVHDNIIEASWEALVDSVEYKLFKDEQRR